MALLPQPPPPVPPPPAPVTGPEGYDDEPLHRSSPPPPAAGRDRAELSSEEQIEMGEQFEMASRGARLGARIIDVLIVAFILFNLIAILTVMGLVDFEDSGTPGDSEAADFIRLMLILTAIWCVHGVYEAVLIAVKGQTLGKMIVRIKVVRADSGSVPGAGKSVIRWIIPTATALLLPFGGFLISLLVYISLLWDSNHQGWHDKAARTLVVKAI